MCPEGYTGVDCAEGLPANRDPAVDARLSREQATASDYFDAAHLYDNLEGKEPFPGDAALYAPDNNTEDSDSCPKLWGKCRKGQATSPRIFVYTLPGPMIWNDTKDVDYGRPMNIMFLERLLASEHRVADPEEADYFFLPMVGGVRPVRPGAAGAGRPYGKTGNRLDGLRYVKNHPVYRKYWLRNGGADHLSIGCDDAGARAYWHGEKGDERQDYPDEAMKVIFISHMGLHDGMERTGYRGAFIPGQDIVIPPLQPRPQIEKMLMESPIIPGSGRWDPGGSGGVDGEGRNTILFFAGSVKPLKPWMDCPPKEKGFSCNVRKSIIAKFQDTEGFHLFKHQTPDYHKEMAESHFCLGVSGVGGGWGRRHTLAAMHGCIPVMIMDGSSLELEELIPWEKMSVRVAERDIERLPEILKEVMADTERMRSMRAELGCVWPRFLWSSIEGSHAGEDGTDDAFASLMDILRRRLGGRGAGDVVRGVGSGEGEGEGEGEGGGGGGNKGEEYIEQPSAALALSSQSDGGEASKDDNPPRLASQEARVSKKTRKSHEFARGWHPTKKRRKKNGEVKTTTPKKENAKSTKRRNTTAATAAAAAKKSTVRFRRLLENGVAAATEESEAAVGVVKAMPSACTRSSAKAAAKGHVPSLCYSNKQKRRRQMGDECLPVMNFDTPKGGAVCVGVEVSSAEKGVSVSATGEGTPSVLFPCKLRHSGHSSSVVTRGRVMLAGLKRRVLRALEYVKLGGVSWWSSLGRTTNDVIDV